MTPLQIGLMLHYYTTPRPYAEHEPAHANSGAVCEQRLALYHAGMLETHSGAVSGYRVTEKGEAYVKALCAVQVPICKWVQPVSNTAMLEGDQ
jgi:hypothetical protein